MFLGTIEHMFIQWHLKGLAKKEPVMDFLDPLIEAMMDGIRAKTQESGLVLRLNIDDAKLLNQMIQSQEEMENREYGVSRKSTKKDKHLSKKKE